MIKTTFWKQPSAALLAELVTSDGGLTSPEAAYDSCAMAVMMPPLLGVHQLGFDSSGSLPTRWLSSCSPRARFQPLTGDVASYMIIASIVVLSVLLDFAQASQAQNAVDALRQQVALRADVRRDGTEISLPVVQLVPGDIVRLAAGDMVPADGVLLSSRDFFVNQALLTGESFPVEKPGKRSAAKYAVDPFL